MTVFNKIFGAAPPVGQPIGPNTLQQQIDYNRLIQMGASMMSGVSYTPPPPPKVQLIGGDHPWQQWLDVEENLGNVSGWVYRDIFIPEVIRSSIVSPPPSDWPKWTLEERREYIYLEARKRLIVGT